MLLLQNLIKAFFKGKDQPKQGSSVEIFLPLFPILITPVLALITIFHDNSSNPFINNNGYNVYT